MVPTSKKIEPKEAPKDCMNHQNQYISNNHLKNFFVPNRWRKKHIKIIIFEDNDKKWSVGEIHKKENPYLNKETRKKSAISS